MKMNMNMSSCQSFEMAPAPSSMMTANVSGWLMKRKNKEIPADAPWQKQAWHKACASVLGPFNRRFFWMDFNIHLVYYAESAHAKRVAFIPFSRLRAVTPITSPVKINAAREGWVWGVTLRTVNRSLDLWAQSEAEQLMWLDALGKAINDESVNPLVIPQSTVGNLLNRSAYGLPTPSTPQLALAVDPRWANVENINHQQSQSQQSLSQQSQSGALAALQSGKTSSLTLPPIKERTTWDALSDDGNVASAGRKWDDWDH